MDYGSGWVDGVGKRGGLMASDKLDFSNPDKARGRYKQKKNLKKEWPSLEPIPLGVKC